MERPPSGPRPERARGGGKGVLSALDPTPRLPPFSTAPAPQAVLTVSGVDRPGVTARLFSALAEGGPALEVLDVEQVVVHGHLVLGVVVGSLAVGDSPAADEGALLAHLERLATDVAA